jgi:predicted MFS family arabinose efflux permease
MLSLARYAELLRIPGLRATLAASVIGRVPVGVTGLSLLLFVQATTQSFAHAGAASGCYVAGLACAAPAVGRVIDRWGPRRPLAASALLYPLALLLLVAAVRSAFPEWAVLGLAALAGASLPPITVCMRSYLKQQLGDHPLLVTAYSFESVLIETMFILGPMLVALFVAISSAALGVMFAAGCAFAGTAFFLRSPALAHWRNMPPTRASLFGPLAERRFTVILPVIFPYSIAFGLIEIGVTAFAAETGRRSLAGVMLGFMSAGSVLGGLAYGSRTWRPPISRQLAIALFLMGVGAALLALLSRPLPFLLLGIVTGVVMAPILAMQSLLVARSASPDWTTEAFTWAATGLLAGVGLGIAAGGWMLAFAPASAVLAAAGAASIVASVLARSLL